MARYVTSARAPVPVAWWDQIMQPLPHPVVYSSDAKGTGLVTPEGLDILRVPDPIGFLPAKET